jgi:hypothetical protein
MIVISRHNLAQQDHFVESVKKVLVSAKNGRLFEICVKGRYFVEEIVDTERVDSSD